MAISYALVEVGQKHLLRTNHSNVAWSEAFIFGEMREVTTIVAPRMTAIPPKNTASSVGTS